MRRFVGSGIFCVKICDNSITSPDYCLNIYDLIGCDYNMPTNVQNGTFTSCEGDLQDVVGVYSVDGVSKYCFDFFSYPGLWHFLFLASTWSMPQTLVGNPPYQPRVPASSNCQTFQSTDLFAFTSTVSFLFFYTTQIPFIVLSCSSRPDSFLYLKTSSSATATGTKASSSGGSGSSSGSGASSTSTSSQSSALSSIGVPPAFYAFGLGIIAGVALVF